MFVSERLSYIKLLNIKHTDSKIIVVKVKTSLFPRNFIISFSHTFTSHIHLNSYILSYINEIVMHFLNRIWYVYFWFLSISFIDCSR